MSSLEQKLSTLALKNITACLKRRKTCDRTCDEGCRFYVGEDARNRALSKAISLLNAECVQERLAEGLVSFEHAFRKLRILYSTYVIIMIQ